MASTNAAKSAPGASPPIPMNSTWSPNCSWTSATAGPSARHDVHHGAQNHTTRSLSANDPSSIVSPEMVVNSPLSTEGSNR